MPLYIVRHAKATQVPMPDEERPLVDRGWDQAERVGARLAAAGVQPERVYHSGLVRARQTADVLARHLGVGHVERREGLLSGDDPAPVAAWAREEEAHADLMLVSHMPFVDRLVSLLVAGDSRGLVEFRTCAVARLSRRAGSADYAIDWVLTPKLA